MPSGSHLSESLPHTRHQTTNAVCFMLSVGISTAVSARCVLIVALAPELNLDLICFTQQRMVCALWCPFKSPQQSLPCEFCFVPYSCMKPVMSKYFTDGAIQKTTCYDQNTLRQVMRPRFASMHESILFRRSAGIVVMWTRPAASTTLICVVVVSASSGPSPQEAPVIIATRHESHSPFLLSQSSS